MISTKKGSSQKKSAPKAKSGVSGAVSSAKGAAKGKLVKAKTSVPTKSNATSKTATLKTAATGKASTMSKVTTGSKVSTGGKIAKGTPTKGLLSAKLTLQKANAVEEKPTIQTRSLAGRSLEQRWSESKTVEPARPEPRPIARPVANPLKKKEMDMFKELLHEEKQKILRHLEEVSASSEQQLDTSTASGDAADIASLEMTQASLQKIGKREAYLLKKIDLALAKIENGTYGECESCGEPISIPRLKARPVAQLCIDCKTEQEAEERRFSSRDHSSDEDSDGSEDSEEG